LGTELVFWFSGMKYLSFCELLGLFLEVVIAFVALNSAEFSILLK
jgi:hypothetical protein